MHVFLTGALQVGKSTIVRRVMDQAQLLCDGFITFLWPDRQAADRRLYLASVGEATVYSEEHVAARFTKDGPVANTPVFDMLGASLLKKAGERADLIIMDECGRIERDAHDFQRAVLSALDGETPVLGVVRHDAGGWTNQIRMHPKVRVITVTEDNRDALVGALCEHYLQNRTGEFIWNQS